MTDNPISSAIGPLDDEDLRLIWTDGNQYPLIGKIDKDGWAYLTGSPFDTSIVEAKYVDRHVRIADLTNTRPDAQRRGHDK
jgi:hypothetical protein